MHEGGLHSEGKAGLVCVVKLGIWTLEASAAAKAAAHNAHTGDGMLNHLSVRRWQGSCAKRYVSSEYKMSCLAGSE